MWTIRLKRWADQVTAGCSRESQRKLEAHERGRWFFLRCRHEVSLQHLGDEGDKRQQRFAAAGLPGLGHRCRARATAGAPNPGGSPPWSICPVSLQATSKWGRLYLVAGNLGGTQLLVGCLNCQDGISSTRILRLYSCDAAPVALFLYILTAAHSHKQADSGRCNGSVTEEVSDRCRLMIEQHTTFVVYSIDQCCKHLKYHGHSLPCWTMSSTSQAFSMFWVIERHAPPKQQAC